MKIFKEERGQVVIILLLTIVVALAIGLSISTRSISEISTATKTEQSSRAFSAAEAGIEKVLQNISGQTVTTTTIDKVESLSNQARADITTTNLYPPKGDRRAIEYGFDGIGRDDVAHVWLVDPTLINTSYYNQPSFDVYFGNPSQPLPPSDEDKPAIEVNVITKSGSDYSSKKLYFDSKDRSSINKFIIPNSDPTYDLRCDSPALNTIITQNSQFYCRVHITGYSGTPILVRIRLLYSSTKQKVAVAPTTAAPCNIPYDPNKLDSPTNVPCSLPPQITLITSTGSSGDVTRKIQLFQQRYVIPSILNYALFSGSDITVQ